MPEISYEITSILLRREKRIKLPTFKSDFGILFFFFFFFTELANIGEGVQRSRTGGADGQGRAEPGDLSSRKRGGLSQGGRGRGGRH